MNIIKGITLNWVRILLLSIVVTYLTIFFFPWTELNTNPSFNTYGLGYPFISYEYYNINNADFGQFGPLLDWRNLNVKSEMMFNIVLLFGLISAMKWMMCKILEGKHENSNNEVK